ncbi:unnamed protein product, partial [Dovyalis caffra]
VDWWIYDKDYTSKYINVPIMGHPLGYNDKVFTYDKDGHIKPISLLHPRYMSSAYRKYNYKSNLSKE